MDESTKQMIGSEFKDLCNYWHKQNLGSRYYALDIDLVMIEKEPHDGPVCVIDWKKGRINNGQEFDLGFAETLTYKWFLDMNIYVIIIFGLNAKDGPFDIVKLLDANYREKGCPFSYEIVKIGADWDFIKRVEDRIRGIDKT